MSISASLLPEFDQETATTRRVLERLPLGDAAKQDWRPHEKSMTMQRLAGHISEMCGWLATTINTPELDFGGPEAYKPFLPATTEELLAHFDKGTAEARAALAGATDAQMMETWTLKFNGNVMFSMPRVAVVRGMCMNHVIHHRGQLSVYLRMNGVPVPSIYGPSADEGNM